MTKITSGNTTDIITALNIYAPEQGGIEFQTDQPQKIHSWHKHSVDEKLIVLEGCMLLEWKDNESSDIQREFAKAGDIIDLPANTIHQSINGDKVCRYLILPEGGKAAETTVL